MVIVSSWNPRLFGINIVQTWIYVNTNKDRWPLQLLVSVRTGLSPSYWITLFVSNNLLGCSLDVGFSTLSAYITSCSCLLPGHLTLSRPLWVARDFTTISWLLLDFNFEESSVLISFLRLRTLEMRQLFSTWICELPMHDDINTALQIKQQTA
jgi:hypothetical protein